MQLLPHRRVLAAAAAAALTAGCGPDSLQTPTEPRTVKGSVPGNNPAAGFIGSGAHLAQLPSTVGSTGSDINDAGQIVGLAGGGPNGMRAYLWTPDRRGGSTGTTVDLGTLAPGARWTEANGINDRGQIVGAGDVGAGPSRSRVAWIWNPTSPRRATGVMVPLAVGGTQSAAYDINAAGQVVGYYHRFEQSMGMPRGFLWTPTERNGTVGQAVDIGSLGSSTYARALNDYGQVAGESYVEGAGFRPILWTPHVENGTTGRMIELPMLPGALWASAMGINRYGQVVGVADFGGFLVRRAFLWTPATRNGTTGTLVDLGNIGGSANAYDINDEGMVTGDMNTPGRTANRTFLWVPTRRNGTTGVLHLLDPMRSVSSYGSALNNAGQVAGQNAQLSAVWNVGRRIP